MSMLEMVRTTNYNFKKLLRHILLSNKTGEKTKGLFNYREFELFSRNLSREIRKYK